MECLHIQHRSPLPRNLGLRGLQDSGYRSSGKSSGIEQIVLVRARLQYALVLSSVRSSSFRFPVPKNYGVASAIENLLPKGAIFTE